MSEELWRPLAVEASFKGSASTQQRQCTITLELRECSQPSATEIIRGQSARGEDIRPPCSTHAAYLESIELRLLIDGNGGVRGSRVKRRSRSSYVGPRTRHIQESSRQTRQMLEDHYATVTRQADSPRQQNLHAASSQSGALSTLHPARAPDILKPPAGKACTNLPDPAQQCALTDAELNTMISLSCSVLSELLSIQAPERAKNQTRTTTSDQHKLWCLTDVIPTLMIRGLTDQIFPGQQLIHNISNCLLRQDEKKFKPNTRYATGVEAQSRVGDPVPVSRVRIEALLWSSMLYHLKQDKKRGQVKVRHGASPRETPRNDTAVDRPRIMACRGSLNARIQNDLALPNDLLPQHPFTTILSSPPCAYPAGVSPIPLKERMQNSQPARPAHRGGITQTSAILETANPQGSSGSHLAESLLTQVQGPALLSGYSLSQIPAEPMLHDIYEVDMMLRSSPCHSDSSSSVLIQEDWDFPSPGFGRPTISISSSCDFDQQDIYQDQSALHIPNNLQHATMPKQYAQESLSDVLGDDRSLWSMFARRGSSAMQQDVMVDMYRNDPDMRLLGKGDPNSDDFSDLMMLDNFNFTRSSSSTSTTSSASSLSNESLSRSTTRASGIYPSSQPMTSSPRAVHTQSKRPPLLKRISRAGKTSDEAPRSSTKPLPRDTDIKRRKTLKDYE